MTSRKVLLLAVITEILDTNITYPSCISCYSKLLIDTTTNRYHCVKCCTSCDKHNVQWRYRLLVCVSDRTCVGKVVVFGRCLDGFFGKTATEFTRSLDDLEKSGYPAKSLLTEALLQTFLGKYFYFGFKVPGLCSTQQPTALKDVLDQDVSLQPSQFDCSSYSDTNHTLVQQMLASSDAVFLSVTDHMRIMVKQLRTRGNVTDQTQVPIHQYDQNQSNCNKSARNLSNRSAVSTSVSGAASFELGVDSVQFSFETSSVGTGTNEKSNKKTTKTGCSVNQCLYSNSYSRYSNCDLTNFSGTEPMVSHFTDLGAYPDSDTVSVFENSVTNCDVDVDNAVNKLCDTLSDLPVTQKLLFDSPNSSVVSNTSRKIDKELFRREILHSCAHTHDFQFSILSGTSYFYQDTTNNCKNSILRTNRVNSTESDSNLNHLYDMKALQDRSTVDFKHSTSESLLRNHVAAELAMPESEDLNAFFDSELEGFVFSQNNQSVDSNARYSSSESETDNVQQDGCNKLTACNNLVKTADCDEELHVEITESSGKDMNDPNNGLAKNSGTENLLITLKSTVNQSEPLGPVTKMSCETNRDCNSENKKTNISKSKCKDLDFSGNEIFLDSFEEQFFENELIIEQTEAVNDNVHCNDSFNNRLHSDTMSSDLIDDKSKVVEDEDLEQFFADISNYETESPYTDNENRKMSLHENDLEKFFQEISKYELDEHQTKPEVKEYGKTIKTVLKLNEEKDDFNVRAMQNDNSSRSNAELDNGSFTDVVRPSDDSQTDDKQVCDELVSDNHNSKHCDNVELNKGRLSSKYLQCDIVGPSSEDEHGLNGARWFADSDDSFGVDETSVSFRITTDTETDGKTVDSKSYCTHAQRFQSNDESEGRTVQSGNGSDKFQFEFLTSCSSVERSSFGKQATAATKDSSHECERKQLEMNHSSDKISNISPHTELSKSGDIIEKTLSILVGTSFDASNDLFDSSRGVVGGNDSPDRSVNLAIVSESPYDVSVWNDEPIGASTPSADQCIIFDSQDYVVMESDSETDASKVKDEKRMVKFDTKLRRVSSCNFIDLKMRVVESPLLRLDQNKQLKSCLKVHVPKNLNLVSSKNTYENINKVVHCPSVILESSKSNLESSELLAVGADSMCSNNDNASVDLFADSFEDSESKTNVFEPSRELELEENLRDMPVSISSHADFSEHWSEDMSDGILMEAMNNVDNNKTKSIINVTKPHIVDSRQKQQKHLSKWKNVEMSKCVTASSCFEEDLWSPDIFMSQNSTCSNRLSSKVNNRSENVASDKYKVNCKENKVDQNRLPEANKKVGALPKDRPVLKCLALNTPDCDGLSSARNAHKNKQSVHQSAGDKTYNKQYQSSFYSPDLFGGDSVGGDSFGGDSFLDDDEVICDRENNVLCKKLLF